MSFTSWLRNLRSTVAHGPVGGKHRRQRSLRASTHRLGLEVLEDRSLPSTFMVLNLLDSGPDSLRAAVAAANASPGADEIDFGVTGSIGLTSGQLDITDSVTINGPGASALTVSGNYVSRVFGIAGDPTVLIAGLTVANGATADSPGGGIAMAGGALTLDHVTVSGNSAYGTYGDYGGSGAGGGLYVAGGTLTLDHCTVSGNSAVGGLSVGAYAQVGNSGGWGTGGGLYVAGGMVHVNQTIVSENRAIGGNGADLPPMDNPPYWTYGGMGGYGEGGGIYVAAGTLLIEGSTLSGNAARGGYGGTGDVGGYAGWGVGGGLYIASAAPPLANLDTFTESHIINNFADIDPNISGPYSHNGLSVGDVTVTEGNTGTHAITFTVTLSTATSQTVTVDYATADGSATAGSDYQAASGTLTFAPGETSKTVTVQVIGDRLPEPNEAFFVNLSSPTNTTIADGQGVGTIMDDEPRISINDVTVTEGNTGTVNATFTVSLSVAYDVAVTVHYQTANGSATAGSDYAAASGDVTIAAGQTTKTFTVTVIGDRSAEPTENFVVNLSSATNGLIVDSQGVGTILDDEPRISISDVMKLEGKNRTTALFTFTVTLSAAYDQAVTVSYRTVDGTATTGNNDYVAKTGTITFNPGETTKTITIEVKGDSKKEANETFYLDLFGNGSNSLITKSRGVGTILNDD